ncbi:MAG: hypothetical protein GHCLOJNM_03475 [bacterium]|nr:hypothetical protein [bacterium]
MSANRRSVTLLHHGLLAFLSLVFSLPFLWMLSTSMKADDEIIHDPMVWFPEIPNRVRHSPYLDVEAHPPRWRRPSTFPESRDWDGFVRQLREETWTRAKTLFTDPSWPQARGPEEPAFFTKARKDIEDFLWMAVHNRVPEGDWAGPEAARLFVERITQEDVAKAWLRVYRGIEIGGFYFRNASARDIGRGEGSMGRKVPYTIRGSEQPVEIARADIGIVSPSEKLEQIMVRIKGDASYHRLSATLLYRGSGYRTEAPTLLSLGEYQDVFWTFNPQRKYEVEHLTLTPDPNLRNDLPDHMARMILYLLPTPYWRVVWERLTENCQEVFRWVPYATYTWVTVKITFWNILGQLLACSLVGFAFARLSFPGRDLLFVLMLATMMLPPQVTMVPQFVLFSKLGMYNTLFPLTIMSFTGAPFFIFLMRQFYMGIPQDLTDAAKIDGCGYFTIYWRILLPLVKPALAAIAIFQFQNTWNEFLQPLIYITDEDKTPMSVGLFIFRQTQAQGGQWAELMAAASMMTFPIIFLFFFTQRYFIQGVTLTGLKG